MNLIVICFDPLQNGGIGLNQSLIIWAVMDNAGHPLNALQLHDLDALVARDVRGQQHSGTDMDRVLVGAKLVEQAKSWADIPHAAVGQKGIQLGEQLNKGWLR